MDHGGHQSGERPSATRPIFTTDKQVGFIRPLSPGPPTFTIRGSVASGFLANIEGLAYSDGIVHCACYGGYYATVNVTDPDNPYLVGYIQNPILGPFVNRLSGSVEVVLKDQYALVASYGVGYLTTVDFSDLANPQIVASLGTPPVGTLFHVRGIASQGDFAYVSRDIGRGYGGFHVINTSDPTSMSITSSIDQAVSGGPTQTLAQAWHVAINEDATVAYVTTQGSTTRLTCIDISDKFNATVLGSVASTGGGWGCSYRDGYCYQGTGVGLRIVNVTDPTAPVIEATGANLPIYGTLPLRSDYVLTCYPTNDALAAWDVSDPTTPVTAGWAGFAVQDPVTLNGARDVCLNDNGRFAYVAAYDGNRLTVVGIT